MNVSDERDARYWRIKANGPKRLLKSIGYYLVEVVDEILGVKDVSGELEPLLDGHDEITAAEYEAAKSPAPVAVAGEMKDAGRELTRADLRDSARLALLGSGVELPPEKPEQCHKCGANPFVLQGDLTHDWMVHCTCGEAVALHLTRERAIEVWNNTQKAKPTPPAKPELCDNCAHPFGMVHCEECPPAKPEPVEPIINPDFDGKNWRDCIRQIQCRQEALEAVVRELRKERAG